MPVRGEAEPRSKVGVRAHVTIIDYHRRIKKMPGN